MTNNEKLWSEIKDDLEKTIGESNINAWFNHATELSKIDGQDMYIDVSNNFTLDHIKKRYLSMLEDSAESVLGARFNLIFNLSYNSINQMARYGHKDDNLNNKYTFDNFVVGKSNQFCHAACYSIAQDPGKLYNPLFIYGNSGLGKTHLMHAIGNRVIEENPDLTPMYVSSEQFTNEMVDSIRTDKTADFRERYRNVDVLLIDDIQFLIGKEGTQEEFFHTFNELYQNQKQIVVTSDKPPKDLKGLESRLITRLGGGIIADIESPDVETRIAILRNKNDQEGYDVSDDVLNFIAEQIDSNIRELEGALTRIKAFSNLTATDVTIDTARTVLKDVLTEDADVVVDVDRIKMIVGEEMGVTVKEIDSQMRPARIAYPRQIAMYLTRHLMDISLPSTGMEFGGRDHSTVIYAVNKIEDEIKEKPETKKLIDRLIAKITSK